METTLTKIRVDHDFILKPQAPSFIVANGINHSDPTFRISDIEMVALQSLTYTSLKDLLPASPTSNRKDSWREIQIKDPLLQHAAWAYLQPRSKASGTSDRNLAGKLKDRCRGLFGCFGEFLNDVVWRSIKRLFSEDDEDVDDKRARMVD
ncbi:hypothetical protein NMG60_11015856 [Bertholletia excelsa]